MRIVGVIPARFKSTRLEGKPLMDILGKPMIQHVYERAVSAGCMQDILVATDDARIQQAVEHFGGKAVMTSSGHSSGTDRVGEAVQNLDVDVVVNIQGDEPLIDPVVIKECVQALEADPLVPVATVMRAIDSESDNAESAVVKVVRDRAGRALYFSRSQIPFPRTPPEGFKMYEHMGLYAYTKDCLLRLTKLPPSPLEMIEGLEQLRALENGIPIRVVETQCTCPYLSVDTPQDLERVRRIMATGLVEMGCDR